MELKTAMLSTTWTLVLDGAFFPVTAALSEDRSAEQILKELDDLQAPRVEATKRNDEKYFQEFLRKRNLVWSTRDALILEFYKVAPRHQRIPKLMVERWAHFVYTPPYSLESLKEIDERSLFSLISPRAADPNRIIRSGRTLSTTRRTSSSRTAGLGAMAHPLATNF